jgi:hypothetical protein
MSRRRGVVQSDDEETSPRVSSRPSEVDAPTLPNVVKLETEHYQKMRLVESEMRAWSNELVQAMSRVSDAAVGIEELKDMPRREEVCLFAA